MTTPVFVGRSVELSALKALHQKKRAGLVVLKGRRRIGKSRLIAEFAARTPKSRFWSFAGLAPQAGVTAQNQRDHFARQLALQLKIPPLTFQDWSDALAHLSLHLSEGSIVLFDEISWMAAKDPTFIPKLKAWWDTQKSHVLLVLCGSISTWIEENILSSTAFFGRVTLTLTLEPLSISESAELLSAVGFKGSAYEHYTLLCVLGGVPWYLEQIKLGATADETIKALCFQKDALLVLEFDRIFHDLFNGKGVVYKQILRSLKEGMKTLADIRNDIRFSQSGTLSQMMEHLIIAGFVKKQPLWSFKTEKFLKRSLYRIADPYLRFYLKLIEPNQHKINQDAFKHISLSKFPGFESHLGLQLEYLLLQNREILLKSIGVSMEEVSCDGPYHQIQSSKIKGCQIDYLVQTRRNNLLVCEFKFTRRELGIEIIEEVTEKMGRLKIPKGYAVVPVLFHLGGISPSVEAQGRFFYRVIDISDFLEFHLS